MFNAVIVGDILIFVGGVLVGMALEYLINKKFNITVKRK